MDKQAPTTRAYSVLEVKALDEDRRIITGIATTPVTDRVGDIVEPMGAEFDLPLPFLWQHNSMSPIGHVTEAKATKKGIAVTIELAKTDEPGALKNRLDEAWQSIKLKLVRGLSIGFKGLEVEEIDGTWGIRFIKWAWFELSAVTIPANQEANIISVKSADEIQLAASGPKKQEVITTPPGVSGKPVNLKMPKEGRTMATVSEQIAALENKRAANVAQMQGISQKSLDEGRTMDDAEGQQFDETRAQNDRIDVDITRLKALEATLAATAKPVPVTTTSLAPSPGLSVKAPPKLEPGISFTRLVKVKMAARLNGDNPVTMAQRMYGADSETFDTVRKANEVVAGTTLTGNWAADLISPEGAAVAAFLEYLRPQTILGKFGTGGVPSLTRLDFYSPYITETGAGDAYWVGEGKPKPLTSFNYDRSTLTPLKIANIAVLTEENIRYSSPNSDMIVRNALVKAIAAGLDTAFIDPTNAGTTNVKPASVTNGAETIVSSGDEAEDVRTDVRALFQKFIDANNPPSQGVWVLSATNALALSMMVNALGQPEFPGITMNGGTFQGMTAITSQHISDVIALINASDIFLGDEGGVAVDMSREASIEMRSTGLGMDATAGTATVGSVSMFQTNSVALRAERTINWKRARDSAVAYLTSVGWGGPVPAS